jgi:hypothetical protein
MTDGVSYDSRMALDQALKPRKLGPGILEILARLRSQFRIMGLLGLSSRSVRESPFAKVTFDPWLRRSEVVGLVFRLASEYCGESLVPDDHPAMPNRKDWPNRDQHAGSCGERRVSFHHCVSSYHQAWYLQLFRKDDGFPTLINALDVVMTKNSFRAGMEFIQSLLSNGYCISDREFSGASKLLADVWIKLGDDVLSLPLDFSSARLLPAAIETLQSMTRQRVPSSVRASAVFDWAMERVSDKVAAVRKAPCADDWILGLCELKQLAGFVWDIYRTYLYGEVLTPERKAALGFIQELEADIAGSLGAFDISRKLTMNPGAMSWIWGFYRVDDSENWVANIRRDRLAIPDALLGVVGDQHPLDAARPEWPDHWVHFTTDFAQPLCHLRGGNAEIIRWTGDTVESSAETASTLDTRMGAICSRIGNNPSSADRADVLQEFNGLRNEFRWSSWLRLEQAVQKDESGKHSEAANDLKDAIVLEPTHWPTWRSFAVVCKNLGQDADMDVAMIAARFIKSLDLEISKTR